MLKSSITVPLPGPKLVFPHVGQLVVLCSRAQALVVLVSEAPEVSTEWFRGVVVYNDCAGGSELGGVNQFDALAFEPFKGSVTISNAE